MDNKFIDVDYLDDAVQNNKKFIEIRNKYKRLIYGNVNITSIIFGSLLFGVIVALIGFVVFNGMKEIFNSKIDIFFKIISVVIMLSLTPILWKFLDRKVVAVLVKFIFRLIGTTESRNEVFIRDFCNNKKLCREQMYNCKKKYEELNEKWKISSKKKAKIYTNIILCLPYYYVNVVWNSLPENIGQLLLQFFSLLILLQEIDIESYLFSFDPMIERYEYVLTFGYDLFERNYKN